jgi:L-glutamine-phosphate cytidylyltransferase
MHTTPPTSVSTAVLLAAGSGRRLLPLTRSVPKCLVRVGDRTILQRFIEALEHGGWRRLVIATGHLADRIDAFVDAYQGPLEVETVFCPDYEATNNIVSLHAVRERIDAPVLIAEADLVLAPGLLSRLSRPNHSAVDRFDPTSMHGTTLSLDSTGRVRAMQVGAGSKPSGPLFKTVNLTSLSADAWCALGRQIEARVSAGDVGSFYEAAIADLVAAGDLSLRAVHFDTERWVEVDSAEDLAIAERTFATLRSARARPQRHLPSGPSDRM